MSNFLKNFEDEIAYQKTSRGEGTGPVSRILSGVNILAMVYLLITLLKSQFYIPIVLFLIVGFTKFAHWISIGLFVYFITIKFWTGVFIIGFIGLIGWLSVWYGVKNVKKNLYSSRARVDPFEGMSDLIFTTIFQIVFFATALLSSGILSAIFWVLFGVVILFETSRFYYRLSSPWRQLHYPLMVRYASIAGYQTGIAKNTDKEFDMDQALQEFVKNIYPNWSDPEIESFLYSMYQKMDTFSDEKKLIEVFKQINPSLDSKKLDELLGKIHELFKKKNPRWVVAEIIERDYGVNERIKYLHHVIFGRAD